MFSGSFYKFSICRTSRIYMMPVFFVSPFFFNSGSHLLDGTCLLFPLTDPLNGYDLLNHPLALPLNGSVSNGSCDGMRSKSQISISQTSGFRNFNFPNFYFLTIQFPNWSISWIFNFPNINFPNFNRSRNNEIERSIHVNVMRLEVAYM